MQVLKVDNPLVVPVDKKIRIITTANDVIHAFYVHAIKPTAQSTPRKKEKIGMIRIAPNVKVRGAPILARPA